MIVDSGVLERESIPSSSTISRKLSCFLAIDLCIESTSEVNRAGKPLINGTDSPGIAIFSRDHEASAMFGTGNYTISRFSPDQSTCNGPFTSS